MARSMTGVYHCDAWRDLWPYSSEGQQQVTPWINRKHPKSMPLYLSSCRIFVWRSATHLWISHCIPWDVESGILYASLFSSLKLPSSCRFTTTTAMSVDITKQFTTASLRPSLAMLWPSSMCAAGKTLRKITKVWIHRELKPTGTCRILILVLERNSLQEPVGAPTGELRVKKLHPQIFYWKTLSFSNRFCLLNSAEVQYSIVNTDEADEAMVPELDDKPADEAEE